MTVAGTKKSKPPQPPHASQPPQTAGELPKSYTPAAVEGEIRARWDEAHAFHADPNAPGKPFCILIPPPNVTAALHLGHAFNNTLQDVLTRYHRMRGFSTLWMPGTDHAGIATQAVVEKRLMLQGKRRTDFTREQFIAKVQEWKDEYEATIIEQLKAMGASCDFARTRFTMDEVCAKAVREAFFRLFKDGLIYRGKRLVNWDPVTQTALADDEVEMEEVQGQMWYLRYPIERHEGTKAPPERHEGEDDYITVATTRPETMLGDTAIAMNPKDPRASKYIGRNVRLPIVDRIVPIIADDYVVMPPQFGGDPNDPKAQIATGFLKVTPAHDPNDWDIRQRHPEIGIVNVLAPDATISDKYGWTDVSPEARQFIGMTREQAQKAIAKWFKDHGLLEEAKPYTHSVGHSYRSHVPIEPYLSDQWYVRVTDDTMRGEALRAMSRDQFDSSQRAGSSSSPSGAARSGATVGAEDGPARAGDGALRFYPSRYAKTFQLWHENLRDWCISRQLWWGHRIPVWSLEGEFVSPGRPEPDSPPIGTDLTLGNTANELFPGCACQSIVTGEWRCTDFVCVPPTEDEGRIIARLEEMGFVQDPDVLDTWFSSGLWPISTMGWPRPEDFPKEFPEGSNLLNTFNPSTVLLTAREIITLWVSRMVMFNRYFRDGKLPFKDVYIHAMIQDGYGQKMSKSLGNGVDPRDIIHSHGADALRFVMTKLATSTQDVRLPVDMVCPHCGEPFQPKEITTPSGGYRVADSQQTCPKCKKQMVSGYGFATGLANPTKEIPLARNTSRRFDEGRNFANKIWNATRFALSNLTGESTNVDVASLPLADRWIISRLHRTLRTVEEALKEYQFSAYADAMYDFFWRDFCDWYLEAIKPTVKGNPAQQQVLRTVLNASIRLLHPIMPFITESLWPAIAACGSVGFDGIKLPASDLLATAAWPEIKPSLDDQKAIAQFERIQALTNMIRTVRAERQVPPKKKIRLTAPAEVIELIDSGGGVVQTLAMLEAIDPARGARIQGAISLAFEGHELLLSGLIDEVDVAAEKARLSKLIADKTRAAEGYRSKLSNEGYVSKAPPEKVEETRRLLDQALADIAAGRKALESLGQS